MRSLWVRLKPDTTYERLFRADDELALHAAVAGVARQVAVEAERARAVGAEVERRGAARGHAADDAVLVDGEAVGDILAADRHAHEVVLRDLEAIGRELKIAGREEELRTVGGLILCEQPGHER